MINVKRILFTLVFIVSLNDIFAGNFFSVDKNVNIYYEDIGKGETIIFVPGWTFTTDIFVKQKDYFSKSHRVVTFDLRSHGRSSLSSAHNNYQTAAADLELLIKHLKIKSPILIGWSFGCLVNWQYIRDHGTSEIKANVCIDLSPTPLTVNKDDWTEGSVSDIAGMYQAINTVSGQKELIRWYAENVMIEQPVTDDILNWIVNQSIKTPTWAAQAYLASGMFSNYLTEAKKADDEIEQLFFVANHWSETAQSYLSKQTPKSQVSVFGGHMMFWEYANKFNPILENFINSVRNNK